VDRALPEPLVAAYLQRRLVLVLGPRVSGGPDPATLAQRVIAAMQARLGSLADPTFFTRMSQRLARGRASSVLGELRRVHAVVAEQEIKAALSGSPANAPLAGAVPALAPMLQLIVTADLDRTLDVAFGGRWPEFSRTTLEPARHYLFKLHGVRHDPSTWVLTKDDYDRVNHAAPERRRFLEGLLRRETLLFLDFDPNDLEFIDLRAALRTEMNSGLPQHFAYFTDESCDEEDQRALEDAGIRVLSPPGGGDQAGALALLGALARAQAESPGIGPEQVAVAQALAFVHGDALLSWRGVLLVFTANGKGAGRALDIEEELRGLRELLRGQALKLDISPAASFPAVIRDLFTAPPTILHFSAHGSPDGELLLREGDGTRAITPLEIARLLAIVPTVPRLVTFCACFSNDLARAAAEHASFAVGFVDVLPDQLALIFSRTLYERLIGGQDVATAFAAAALASGTTNNACLHTRHGASR
jgi:hypothetical protein